MVGGTLRSLAIRSFGCYRLGVARHLLGASIAAFVALGCNALLGNESGSSADGDDAGGAGASDAGADSARSVLDGGGTLAPTASAGFQLVSLFTNLPHLGARHNEGLQWWRGGLAVTDANVYWLESSSSPLMRWGNKADGGKISTLSLVGAGALRSTKVTGGGYLWLGNGKVVQRLPWGASEPTFLQQGNGEITGIASDGSDCYWTAAGDSRIHRESVLGGSSILTSYLEIPVSLVMGGRDLYWLGLTDESSGSLRTIKSDGTGAREIAKLSGFPRAVGASSTWVYHGLKSDVRRRLTDPTATTDESVAADANDPWEFVVNDSYAYWIERGDPVVAGTGRLRRVAHTESKPITLATGLSGPVALAVDGTTVYVAVSGTNENAYADGAILRITPVP